VHVGRCRPRQLSLDRDQKGLLARQTSDLGPRKLFHGVDEHRQPPFFSAAGTPSLGLLSHRPSLPEPAPPGPTVNPEVANSFPATMRERKPARCELLHKKAGWLAVNHRNDRENKSIAVRPTPRPRHRLRLDRHRRRSGPDRADLSDLYLIQFQIGASRPGRFWNEYVPPGIRFSPNPKFPPDFSRATRRRTKVRQSPMRRRARIHTRRCVNRA
jgi:hypothetical protein